jgi:uncharacterized protein YjbI with pentapeptide repeats
MVIGVFGSPSRVSAIKGPSSTWQLADGTPISEQDIIWILAAHRQAVANYRGSLTDYWQPLLGGNLAGFDLQAAVERAALEWPVAGLSSNELPLIDLSYTDLTNADVHGLKLDGVNFSNACLAETNLSHTKVQNGTLNSSNTFYLLDADLSDAIFEGVVAERAMFFWTTLSRCRFEKCNLSGASFVGIEGRELDFLNSDLTDASVTGQLQYARVMDCQVTRTHFRANVDGMKWLSRGEPDLYDLATCENLYTLRNGYGGIELTLLRKMFVDVGLAGAGRKMTRALRRDRIDQLWDARPSSRAEIFSNRFEVCFEKLFFEWPSDYGMDRGRPLRILGLLILCFWPLYFCVLLYRPRVLRAGIWAVRASNAVPLKKHTRAVPLRVHLPQSGGSRQRIRALVRGLSLALFFSVQSTFALGYKDINVGSWIAQMQPREYALRATGWVRSLVGFQSLLSFYLLVLWVLTYFGRPFD